MIPAPEQVKDELIRLILIAFRKELLSLRADLNALRAEVARRDKQTDNTDRRYDVAPSVPLNAQGYSGRQVQVRLVTTGPMEPITMLNGQAVLCFVDNEV